MWLAFASHLHQHLSRLLHLAPSCRTPYLSRHSCHAIEFFLDVCLYCAIMLKVVFIIPMSHSSQRFTPYTEFMTWRIWNNVRIHNTVASYKCHYRNSRSTKTFYVEMFSWRWMTEVRFGSSRLKWKEIYNCRVLLSWFLWFPSLVMHSSREDFLFFCTLLAHIIL